MFIHVYSAKEQKLFGGGSGLSLLLDDTRHFFALPLGTDVGAQTLLQKSKASLVLKMFLMFAEVFKTLYTTLIKLFANFSPFSNWN